jgi:cytolysin (calcineurin-like family phosphatase)
MSTIDRLTNIVISANESTNRMTAPVRRALPANLDRATCIAFLNSVDPQLTPTAIQAAAGVVDISAVDDVIMYAELNTEDSFRLKSSLVETGLLSAGRRINR